MDKNWIPAVYETCPGGVSSAVAPKLLPAGQFAWGFNAAVRGGCPHTRPPMIERMILPEGLHQGSSYFGVQNGMIVTSINGHLYRLRIGNNMYSWETIPLPWYNSGTIKQVWMQQTIESLVVQDGQSNAIIYNGSTAQRAGIDQVPRGRMMAYGNGRLWVAINEKELVAGDIRTRVAGSELRFTETNYLVGGGALYFPRGITGLEFIPVTGAADFGTLLVFSKDSAESIRADVTTRDQWGMPGFVTTVFRDVGCAGDWSLTQVNQDVYWRDAEGQIRSLANGISTNSSPGSTPISREVSRLVDYDSNQLLPFCSAIHFDNRLLMTSSPYLNISGGISFKNLVALDFAPISTNQLKAPPAYDGQWTGIPGVCQLVTGEFNGVKRAFAISSDESGVNRLWEIMKQGRDDISLSCGSGVIGATSIQSFVEYPVTSFGLRTQRKRLERCDVWVSDLVGELELVAYWRSDKSQKWTEWDAEETCAKTTDAATNTPHTWKNLLPQQRTQIKTFTIPDGIDEVTKYFLQVGFDFQIRLAWRGRCQIEKMILYAAPLDDPDYAERDTLLTECIENDVSNNGIGYIIPTTSDFMAVTPDEAFEPTGEPGGPFTPASITYRIANPSNGPINWTAEVNESWLLLDKAAGTLLPGAFVDVTVSLDADGLPARDTPYDGSIIFTNTSNHCGDQTYPASLTVSIGDAPMITEQPEDQNILAADDAEYSITATGTAPLSYQWEYSAMTPVAWAPLVDGDGVDGATTPNLMLLSVAQDQTNHKVRCRVRNAYGQAASNGAALRVSQRTNGTGPWIVTDPVDQGVQPGDPAEFFIEADGAGSLIYQWQYTEDGSTWNNQTDTGNWSGSDSDYLENSGCDQSDSGRRYRCVVTDDNGIVTSHSALLTVADPVITAQPQSVGQQPTLIATFTVAALGATALSYEWQRSEDGGDSWAVVGTDSDTLEWTTGDLLQDGNLFRCIVTDVAGSVTSDVAQLTVLFPTTPFSVEYDPPYLVQTEQDVAEFTTPVCTPTFGGGYAPFYLVSNSYQPLAHGNNPMFNDEGDFAFSMTLANNGAFSRYLLDTIILEFCDSQGQTCSAKIAVGLLIILAGVVNLGTIAFAMDGDVNDLSNVENLPVSPDIFVAYVVQMQGPATDGAPSSQLQNIINTIATSSGPFFTPISLGFKVINTNFPQGLHYGVAFMELSKSGISYSTEILLITITGQVPP